MNSKNDRSVWPYRFRCIIVLTGTLFLLALCGCSSNGPNGSIDNSEPDPSSRNSRQITEVEVKSTVNDYSWGELGFIAKKISSASTEKDALAIAREYNLTTSKGSLDGTQVKSVTLSNEKTVDVQIVGFYHDKKSSGGKAGITFIFKNPISDEEMNPTETSSGGWKGSDLYSWLWGKGMSMLPSDLREEIVAVEKMTNNAGKTNSVSSVSSTSESLWLFSYAELTGYKDDVLGAEGTQYKLFAEQGVKTKAANKVLQKSKEKWWLRSPEPTGQGFFCCVSEDGNPSKALNADSHQGVAPGFCL